MLKNEQVYMCDKLLAEDFVTNAEDIVNMTGTIAETEDIFENIYNIFDALSSSKQAFLSLLNPGPGDADNRRDTSSPLQVSGSTGEDRSEEEGARRHR